MIHSKRSVEKHQCYDKTSIDCNHDSIPLRKGTFEYVKAVYTLDKKSDLLGHVYIFIYGLKTGNPTLRACGADFLTSNKISVMSAAAIFLILFGGLIVFACLKRHIIISYWKGNNFDNTDVTADIMLNSLEENMPLHHLNS